MFRASTPPQFPLAHALAANALPFLARAIGSRFASRALAPSIVRLVWGSAPLLGIGLGFWGYTILQRRFARRRSASAALLRGSTAEQQRAKEVPPPEDPVDEASWESFPASDPPAFSPKHVR